MCGITGLYSFNTRPDRTEIDRIVRDMTQAIFARGQDSGDVWQDPDMPLALGHRRLSILDLSPLGHQPMESKSGRYMISYNGEIYNFKEIRAELTQAHNVTFRGESDTEIILAAIEQWGVPRTVKRINGMFAFALWDRKAKALHFARDRFGKKPLYIGWAGSSLVFGSELKALCAHPDFNRDIDRASLTSYMRFGYVPAPLCIFKQVLQLPAGSLMSIDLSMLRSGQELHPLIEPYWRAKTALIHARKNPITDLNTVANDFEDLLSNCVRERMISDVPLGAFLSGGIDSSAIVALMQKEASAPVKTYTIGFEEAGFNEAHHAKTIANHLGTDHHELYISSKDARDVVPLLAQIYDEPFADISSIPTYLVSKFARHGVTVALSGDGGDEMLGGYNRHITAPKAWDRVNSIPANLRKPLANMLKSVPPATWDKVRKNHPQFGSHIHKFANILDKQYESDVYLSLVSTWSQPKNFVQGGSEEIIPLVDPDTQIDGLSFAENMMYWDTISYLNGDILTKVDRATMAAGLEARAPLLDQRIYDYVWRLPLEYKIKNGQGKVLLRQVLRNHIPESLFERPKQGFAIPIGTWLRTELKDWAEDLLDEHELRAQGLLDYRAVRTLWDHHQNGRGNHANQLWTVLMFQSWYRHWISG